MQFSIYLALSVAMTLLPMGVFVGRFLAHQPFFGRRFWLVFLLLPILLPPVVVSFFWSFVFDPNLLLNQRLQHGLSWFFHDDFLSAWLVACVTHAPWVVFPIFWFFSTIPSHLRKVGRLLGLSRWQVFVHIELPLVWRGIGIAMILVFMRVFGDMGLSAFFPLNAESSTQSIAGLLSLKWQVEHDQAQALNLSLWMLACSLLAMLGLISLWRAPVQEQSE